MGHKRRADGTRKSREGGSKRENTTSHSGLPLARHELVALRQPALGAVRPHCVPWEEPQQDSNGAGAFKGPEQLAAPPDALPRDAILRRRLEGIKRLRSFYEDVQASLLGHLPELYTAMRAADQQVRPSAIGGAVDAVNRRAKGLRMMTYSTSCLTTNMVAGDA